MRDAPVKTSAFRQGIRQTSATAKERIGTLRILEDGRKFRYAKAGGALNPGQLAVAAVIVAAHIDATVANANNNNTQIVLLVTAGTAIAENALAGGYLHVNDGTLEGNSYRIDSNTAMAADGTAITLNLADPMGAYDGTTEVSLIHNPWAGVAHTTTEESLPAGIVQVSVASGRFFWIQTGGPSICLTSGTPAVGSMLTVSSTEGAVAAINATLDIDAPILGTSWGTDGVDTEYKPIYLTLD